MGIVWCLVFCLVLFTQKADAQVAPFGVNSPSVGGPAVATLSDGNTGNVESGRPAQPTPPKECCAVQFAQQLDCGYPGITEAICNIRGCCFNASPTNRYWCFRPLTQPCPVAQTAPAPALPAFVTPTAPPLTQQPVSIPATQPPATQQPAAKLSRWSKWTSCQGKTCGKDSRLRSRNCVYSDGRQAPASFCTGRTTQTRLCPCETVAIAPTSQKDCKDGSDSCTSFKSLCDSSDLFKKQLCPKTCGSCDGTPTKEKPVESADTCKDQFLSCKEEEIRKLCNDPAYIDQLRTHCPVTCNLCQKIQKPSTSKVCEDKYPEGCKAQKADCVNSENAGTMQNICPVTCNTCPYASASASTSTAATTTTAVKILLATTPASVVGKSLGCIDKVDYCETVESACAAPGQTGETTRDMCALTCGICRQTFKAPRNPASTPFLPVTPSQLPCIDDLEDGVCMEFQYLCSDPISYWTDLCRLTCGKCDPRRVVATTTKSPIQTTTLRQIFTTRRTPPLTPDPPQTPRPTPRPLTCKDDMPIDCPRYPQYCSIIGTGWVDLCRVTCNSCVQKQQPTAPPTTRPTATRNIFSFTSPTMTSVSSPCRDIFLECGDLSYLCQRPESMWERDCPVTCDRCGAASGRQVVPAIRLPLAPISATQPVTPTTQWTSLPPQRVDATTIPPQPQFKPSAQTTKPHSVSSPCRDIFSECGDLSYLCQQPDSMWERDCPVTCDRCGAATGRKVVSAVRIPFAPTPATQQAAPTTQWTPLPTQRMDAATLPPQPMFTPTAQTTKPLSEAPYAWSQWSQCSVTCGKGVKTRARICLKQGTNCPNVEESSPCNRGICEERQTVGSAGGCSNAVVGDWCDRMKKTIVTFCSNELLSSTCKGTCKKC